jgi:hypothetical protein
MNNNQNKFIDYCKKFIKEQDAEKSFLLLNDICELIIKAKNTSEIEEIIHLIDRELLVKKAAEIDLNEEIKNAKEYLKYKSTETIPYAWSFQDYYNREVDFILKNIPKGKLPNRISIVGQGAMPSLAEAFRRKYPIVSFDFYDIDFRVYALSKLSLREKHSEHDQYDRFYCKSASEIECFDSELVIVSNAVIDYLNIDSLRKSPSIFIRSSTPAGSTVYPRLDPVKITNEGYNCQTETDPVYGIHEWYLFTKPQEGKIGKEKSDATSTIFEDKKPPMERRFSI